LAGETDQADREVAEPFEVDALSALLVALTGW
jgi:hypothetical protein